MQRQKNLTTWLGLTALGGALYWLTRQRAEQPPHKPGLALVTGASSGIGAAYARALARRGYDLLLVARRQQHLTALAEELRQQWPIAAMPFPADLTNPADLAATVARIQQEPRLTLLVNCAGFGTNERFANSDIANHRAMIQLHIHAPTQLIHAALPAMRRNHHGGIINVSSIVAYMPTARSSTYCATKAHLITFTQALHQELRGSGVRVQALVAGFTDTEIFHKAGMNEMRLPSFLWMTPEAVVAHSLRDFERGGPVLSIPGALNRVMVALLRRLPRPWLYTLDRQLPALLNVDD